jgi:hypothetical protein
MLHQTPLFPGSRNRKSKINGYHWTMLSRREYAKGNDKDAGAFYMKAWVRSRSISKQRSKAKDWESGL